nr:hypothetical protein Iba_chr11eCG8880 [Ipomoea batatas]
MTTGRISAMQTNVDGEYNPVGSNDLRRQIPMASMANGPGQTQRAQRRRQLSNPMRNFIDNGNPSTPMEVVAGRVVSTSRAHISVSSIMFISHPMSHIQLSESLKRSEEENGNIPKLAVHMTEKEAVKWSGCVYLIWKVVLELKYDFRKAKILKLRIVRNCRKVVLELKPDFRKATILNSRVGELKKHEACLTARLLFGLVFYDALKPKLIVAEWPPYLIDEEVPLTQKQTNSVEFVPPEPHRPPDLTHSLHISSFALHCTGKPLAMELLTTSSENPEAFPKSSNPPSPTVAEIFIPARTEPKFTWPVPLQAKPRSPPSLQYLKMIQLGSSDSSPLQLKMLGVGNEPNPSRVVELQANWPSFLAILAVWAWLLMLKILYCTDWIEISGKSLRQFNSKPGWPQNAGRFSSPERVAYAFHIGAVEWFAAERLAMAMGMALNMKPLTIYDAALNQLEVPTPNC